MEKKFKKGQKVYYASTNIGRICRNGEPDIFLCMVVERTVDACGKVQMTFEDDGNDFVFGRSVRIEYSDAYFSSPDEAFDYLQQLSQAYTRCKHEIHPSVVSDKNKDWHEISRQWSRR